MARKLGSKNIESPKRLLTQTYIDRRFGGTRAMAAYIGVSPASITEYKKGMPLWLERFLAVYEELQSLKFKEEYAGCTSGSFVIVSGQDGNLKT